jgi:hypothetical protein
MSLLLGILQRDEEVNMSWIWMRLAVVPLQRTSSANKPTSRQKMYLAELLYSRTKQVQQVLLERYGNYRYRVARSLVA